VLVDVDILVGAERAVIEDAGEVGPEVVVTVVVGWVEPWWRGFGLPLDWPGAVKLEKRDST
jgi:hypothetical protein